MKCEKCGSENLSASVTYDHDYIQVNGKWQIESIHEQDPGESAQITCDDCGHEMFEDILPPERDVAWKLVTDKLDPDYTLKPD